MYSSAASACSLGQGQQHAAQRLAVDDAGVGTHDGDQGTALDGEACHQRLVGGLGAAEGNAHQLVAGQVLGFGGAAQDTPDGGRRR